jgi:hypothetical protein
LIWLVYFVTYKQNKTKTRKHLKLPKQASLIYYNLKIGTNNVKIQVQSRNGIGNGLFKLWQINKIGKSNTNHVSLFVLSACVCAIKSHACLLMIVIAHKWIEKQ